MGKKRFYLLATNFGILLLSACGLTSTPTARPTISPSQTENLSTPTLSEMTLLPLHPKEDFPFIKSAIPDKAIAKLGIGMLGGAAISKDWSTAAFGISNTLVFCTKETCREAVDGVAINKVILSDDGALAATTEDDERIVSLWNAIEGKRIASIPSFSPIMPKPMAFSPDGSLLAISSWRMITLVKTENGMLVNQVSTPSSIESNQSVDFTPDGKQVVAGTDFGNIYFYSVPDLIKTSVINNPDRWISWIAFSPDGTQLAYSDFIGGGGTYDTDLLHIIDLATKMEKTNIKLNGGVLSHLEYSPNGKMLFALSCDTFAIDSSTGKKLWEGDGECDSYDDDVSFSSDSKLLVWMKKDGQVIEYDATTGRIIEKGLSFLGIIGTTEDIAYSSDGKYLASTHPRSEMDILWDAQTFSPYPLSKFAENTHNYSAISFSPDGNMIATGSEGGNIKFWSMPSCSSRDMGFSAGKSVNVLAFSPDGSQLASGSDDGLVNVWDMQKMKNIYSWRSKKNASVTDIAYSSDGTIIGLATVNEIILLQGKDGTEIITLAESKKDIEDYYFLTNIAFSPDNKKVYATIESKIGVWDTSSGEPIGVIDIDGDSMTFAISPDGKYLAARVISGGIPKTLILYDIDSKQEVFSYQRNDINNIQYELHLPIIFSPDGRFIISVMEDGTMLVWEVQAMIPGE